MWLPVGVNRCQKFSDMLTYTACASVCLKCDKDFYFPAPEEKKGTSKMEHLFFFQRRVQIPVQKCFWILFPSLIFIGEYKEWAWTFGWIRDGECELLCLCFMRLCVPAQGMSKFLSLFSLKRDSPLHTCKCVFIFKSSNRLKIFPHQCTWASPPSLLPPPPQVLYMCTAFFTAVVGADCIWAESFHFMEWYLTAGCS